MSSFLFLSPLVVESSSWYHGYWSGRPVLTGVLIVSGFLGGDFLMVAFLAYIFLMVGDLAWIFLITGVCSGVFIGAEVGWSLAQSGI